MPRGGQWDGSEVGWGALLRLKLVVRLLQNRWETRSLAANQFNLRDVITSFEIFILVVDVSNSCSWTPRFIFVAPFVETSKDLGRFLSSFWTSLRVSTEFGGNNSANVQNNVGPNMSFCKLFISSSLSTTNRDNWVLLSYLQRIDLPLGLSAYERRPSRILAQWRS